MLEALIPAAGRGARLDRPDTPKPLVQVGGQPLILRTLRQLEAQGVTRALVLLGHRGDEVRAAVEGAVRIPIEWLEAPRWAAGLAATLSAARGHLHGAFVLAMADHVYDDALIEAICAAPVEPEGLVCTVDPRPGRVRDLASAVKVRMSEGRVRAIGRALVGGTGVDAGLFLATPALFEHLPATGDLPAAVQALAARDRVRALSTGKARWADVDTPRDLVHVELRLRKRSRVARIRNKGAEVEAQYAFYTPSVKRTEVVVERGLVAEPARLIPESAAGSPVFVFTDETVNALYGERFVNRLEAAGYEVHRMVLPDGEVAKTVSNYAFLVERVLAKGVDEQSVFISLGGGVVCNVCGFVASTMYRGLDLIHVPTTLMAQADAAISHKQAVNGRYGKNMVGTYHAPRRIAVDTTVLQTLCDRRLRDGLAEVIKHALAQDADYAEWLLELHPPHGLNRRPGSIRDPDFLDEVVRRNIRLKCVLMGTDPTERTEGMVLQYGHAVGHSVEHLSAYTLMHGEAVAIGMMVSAHVAHAMGACGPEVVQLHAALLEAYGLPSALPEDMSAEDVLAAMRFDKRHLREGHRMALVAAPGRLWSVGGECAIPVPEDVLMHALRATEAQALRRRSA